MLALAEELHFGRAADRLRVAPSSLSRTIQSVERRIGAPLFARTSRLVALTPIGKQLLDELRPLSEEMQRAIRRATDAGRGIEGELTIGFEAAPAGRFILAVAEGFRAENPRVDVHIRQLSAGDVETDWCSGRFDMVLIGRPIDDPGFRIGPVLISEPRMLAVPSRHPLAAQSAVTLEDLATIDLFRPPGTLPATMIEDRAPDRTPTGRPITYAPAAHSDEEILTRVGGGQGAVVVGEHAIHYHPRPDVVYLPIDDAPPVEHRFAWRACRETALIRAFAAAAAGRTAAHPKA